MAELKIDDLKPVKSEEVKEPTPHEKAAEKLKEAVRALSVDEVEEALTKSTFGAIQLPQEDKRIHELESDLVILKTECSDLRNENRRLKESIDQTNGQLRVRERELDEAKKTISKMKYAHEEEIRALEDELAEAKALAKKGNEYSDRLADNEETFRKMRAFAKSIVGMADSIEGLAYLIQDEAEGRI